MKTLYLECGMGAAGDMLAAALLELLPDPQAFLDEFNRRGIPGVTVSREDAVRCGIRGTHFAVSVDGAEEDDSLHAHGGAAPHRHGGLAHIEHLIAGHLALESSVRDDVLAVFRLLAEAESAVHGVPVSDIHFHEVGTMDAVADVTAVCMLLHRLAPDEIVASPVNVGGGTVRCAHGVLPVPAPATAELLRGLPIYGGEIQSELCTPTGAALLRHFVTRFSPLPLLRTDAIGYGMGKKEFPRANCLRAILGETDGARETILTLSCSVDDMTGEALGFALEQISAAGAADVFTVPVGMKKSRPGVLLTALCREADRDSVLRAIFRHTSTLGVRESAERRYVLDRRIETVDTPLGPVRRKVSSGFGAERSKWEYEDLARLARERGLPLGEVLRRIEEQ